MRLPGVGSHAPYAGAAARAPLPPPARLHITSRRTERHACSRHGRRSPQAAAAVSGGAGAQGGSGTVAAAAATLAAEAAVHDAAPSVTHPRTAAPGDRPPPAAQRGTQPAPTATADAADELAALAAQLGVPPREVLPRHLAVIMDGNSRWATARGLPRLAGYQQGVEALRRMVRCCHAWGVPCLTVYAFSSENWRRGEAEVSALLALMGRVLAAEVAALAAAGVRLRFVGELQRLPEGLRAEMRSAERATAAGTALQLTVAVSYSGRADVAAAARRLAARAAAGQLAPHQITEEVLEGELATAALPPGCRHPDLILRTSGERRLSNFLCYEAAYAELYFSDVLWPDFREAQLAEALQDYAARERRFGGRRHAGGTHAGGGGRSGLQ